METVWLVEMEFRIVSHAPLPLNVLNVQQDSTSMQLAHHVPSAVKTASPVT